MNNRKAIIVSGPNGAGKTTFAKEYCAEHELKYISADLIAESLNPDDLQEVAIEAGRQYFKEVYQCIEKNESFVVESTLSGISFQKVIDSLKNQGYSISIVFVFLQTPESCIERIKERVRRQGHFVPDEDVIRRFYRSIRNFWKVYKNLADRWYLICNSTNKFVEVAFGGKKDYSVSDERVFGNFLKIVEGPSERQ